jgi:hypothetical protein
MKPGSRASPVIKIACSACGARLDERCSGRYAPGRPGTFASEFCRGHPGVWLIDLPPWLSTGRNAPRFRSDKKGRDA